MPFCGYHPKMVAGLATFAEGLFLATLERARAKSITIEEAYRQEVEELGAFIEALEQKYQEVRAASDLSRNEIMQSVADWAVNRTPKV